ncbi:MAG: HAD-IC family P-type ATPase [Clostridiales bacterium]|nr:HAD-IC family P-type ATPase [Clostridiales bacterium]
MNYNLENNDELKKIRRYTPSYDKGLSENEVNQRFAEGLFNDENTVPTKTILQIITGNLCTFFNILNFSLAIIIIIIGEYKNILFMGVVLCNLFIGVIQEIRSKLTIDKLSIIASTKADVIRNGIRTKISIEQIVLDDIIIFESGYQVVTDSIIVKGSCDVNESFVTGESDAIYKKEGDLLLAGSFIVSGKCTAKAERVGKYNYVSKISSGAKYIKKINSEIMRTLNKIVKIISFFIIPVGIIIALNQFNVDENTFEKAVVQSIAAIITIIPEGLMLLSSTVLAVGVVRLARYKVLVQELYCIETLARVDTLCLDKTGTLTEGSMEVIDTFILDETYRETIETALSSIVNSLEDNNPTFNAIKDKYINKSDWKPIILCPFSSQEKWSGVYFEKYGSYIMGAAEFILDEIPLAIKEKINEFSKNSRVILVAHSKNKCSPKKLPKEITPIAFVLIRDKIRAEAKKTLEYFKDQGVSIKVISGDNVETVSGIAKAAGIDGWEKAIDATTINSENIDSSVSENVVFGRVTPIQKKELINAMQKNGHTVAMTGDGVNDVLALKEADCSIAMASGTDAARNVSQLILLDSNFDSMPKVVAEGRRSINNIQRSAAIVMVRTLYSLGLAFIFLFVHIPYPFIPIQQTLINAVSSGIPGIILALEPNKKRIKGNFFQNIMRLALPPSMAVFISILGILVFECIFDISKTESSTICVYVTGFIRLMFLFKVCIPFNIIRGVLFTCMCGIFAGGILLFPEFFNLSPFTPMVLILTIGFIIFAVLIFIGLSRFFNKSKLLSKAEL